MGCQSEVELGGNLTFSVTTHDPDTGVLTDADAVPAYRIYADETATPILTGDMAKLDDANTTGFYTELIACTTGNGFELGKTYTIYIEATVDGDKGGITYAFRVNYLPAVVAGGAGGVFIAGTNAPVTITGSGTALTLTSTGGDGSGLAATGNGSGIGIDAVGGTSGIGLRAWGQGSGAGIRAIGGTSGEGIYAYTAGGNANGLRVAGAGTGAGFTATGGATGPGILATGGGNAAAADGIRAVAGGALANGVESDRLNLSGAATITGGIAADITGNLSGSVGSVTGAVGSVTGAVGSVTGAVGSVTDPVAIGVGGIDTTSFASSAINAAALATDAGTEIANAVKASVVEAQGNYTIQQVLSIVLAVLAGVTADSGATLKSPNGTATRVAATIDGSNNRTAMTLTPSS